MKSYFDKCMNIEQLEQEHKRLVIQLHPDRNPDNPDATAEFQEMQQQYEERKAELNGDYTKARKGRERREREARERDRRERERKEQERREQERRKVEMAVEQARLNRSKSHMELKAGDYIYARGVEYTRSMFDWSYLTADNLLRVAIAKGVKQECVVMIEVVINVSDRKFWEMQMSGEIPDGFIYGGWEVLQKPDPANGIRKGQRVAKVVMFRSEHYCCFGNPMGDSTISDYYVPCSYETMYSDRLHRIKADLEREAMEKARIEAEKKAKLLAEQQPLIDEWAPKLIALSKGLVGRERLTVTISNFKTMLKGMFPGAKFTVKADRYNDIHVKWEDGPTPDEVRKVMDLFDAWKAKDSGEPTPWMERFGALCFSIGNVERKMSAINKAKILQQLGQVTDVFTKTDFHDEVTVDDFSWMMLHALVGIAVSDPDARLCLCTMHADGRRTVTPAQAVSFIFRHTSYTTKKAAKKKAA